MKLDWRQSILYIIVIGMECCWLYALLIPLNEQVAGEYLSIPGLLLLYPLAFIFNKLIQQLRWSKVYLYSVSGLAWAIGMLLMVKIQLYGSLGLFESAWLLALPGALGQIIHTLEPEILLFGGSIVLWWLGWRLARRRVTFAASVAEFQFGLIILLVVFLITSQLGVGLASSIPVAMVFFLLALAGMSLAHSQDGAGWLTSSNRGVWSGLLLAGIGLILVLGLLIGLVMTPDFFQLILVPFKWMWGMLWKFILFLISLLPEPEPVELPPIPSMPEMNPPSEGEFRMWSIPQPLLDWLRFGYNIFWIGFLAIFLWRISSQFLGWLRRKAAASAGAEVEPLPGAFRADFLNLLKHVVLSLLRLRLPFWRRKKPESVSLEAASVRQIYREFLRWAANGGWPRPVSHTPYEYLHTLKGLLPVAQRELHFITEQYMVARYSPSSPTEEELSMLRQSWHQLRQNHLEGPGIEHTHEQEVTLK